MHQPRSYGLHIVGGEDGDEDDNDLSDEDLAAIEAMARKLTNLKDLSGLDSAYLVRTLPSGGIAVARDAGGVFRISASSPPSEPADIERPEVDITYVPMLFSGVITRAMLFDGEATGIRLTELARRRIAGYTASDLPPKDVQLQRFRIGYNNALGEFRPRNRGALFHTQYVALFPTWYSGAMAEVVQIVAGYGRQSLGALPDDPVERAVITLPKTVTAAIKAELKDVVLPGYIGIPPAEGEILFDYKANHTNAVAFDDERNPWLLRISSTGVYAMPLPLIPATTTRAFREWMEDVGDDEILSVLDRFGGMPSGETFPSGSAFQAWMRAGVITKVSEVADFYDHNMYSTACGWTFNTTASEGYNTCYDYYDDEGLAYGLTYKIRLSIASAPNGGRLLEKPVVSDEQVLAYLSGLRSQLNKNSLEHLAIEYKLRRAGVDDIRDRASAIKSWQAELEYWHQREMEPIAPHAGNVSEVARGYLYSPEIFKYQPQIKFPEPFMTGCLSFDFTPLEQGRRKPHNRVCETIMFCYYRGDSVVTVKYFRDPRGFTKDVESNFEPCMTVGSWEQTVTTGSSTLAGSFCTSTIDDRTTLSPSVTQTKIKGTSLGYDSPPFFSFTDFFSMDGTLWRYKYISYRATTKNTVNQYLETAICIPYMHRNTALHAKREGESSGSVTESCSRGQVKDPYTYQFWTYDSVFHWTRGLPVMKGKPYPSKANPVWVEMEDYSPSQCSDFADNGPWISSLPTDYAWLIHPDSNVYLFSGGGSPPPVDEFHRTQNTPAKIDGDLKADIGESVQVVHMDLPDTMYFLGSPSDVVGIFYRDACEIVFGDAKYANVMEGRPRPHWGYSRLVDHATAYNFIGVIHE